MRVLITGGAGFIGSHLADAYLQRGDKVSVIDDLSTGRIENIQHLKGKPNFEYTIDTVHNHPVTAELVDQADVVFHLAAAVGAKLIVAMRFLLSTISRPAPSRTFNTLKNIHVFITRSILFTIIRLQRN